MDFLEKNKEALQKILRGELDQKTDEPPVCHVHPSRSGLPTLEVEKDGKNVLLHSAYDPKAEAERWASGQDVKDKKVVVVLGFGLGYHAECLAKHLDEKTCLVLAERNTGILNSALRSRDLTGLLSRKKIIFYAGEFDFDQIFNGVVSTFESKNLGEEHIAILIHKPSFDLSPADYRYFSQCVRDTVQYYFVAAATQIYESYRWATNALLNISHAFTHPPVKNLFGNFQGKPGIVVSAGPSLDGNVRHLRDAQGKAVIICVGTSLRVLKTHDVQPDMVCIVDGSLEAHKHIEGVEDKKAFLVTDVMAYPESLNQFKGRMFLGEATSPSINPIFGFLLERLGSFGPIRGTFSVATMAFRLAESMGCNPIILVGQDLAFPGGKSHAEGTIYREDVPVEHESFFKIADNSGSMVTTNKQWLSTLRAFERMVASFKGVCVNTSLQGARMEGTRVMELSDAVQEYCKEEVLAMESISSYYDRFVVSRRKVRRAAEDIQKVIDKVKDILEESKNGLDNAKQMVVYLKVENRSNSDADVCALGNRLQACVDKLTAYLKELTWLNPWLQEVNLYLTKSQREKLEGVELLYRESDRAGVYCEAIFQVSEDLIPLVKHAKESLEKLDGELVERRR